MIRTILLIVVCVGSIGAEDIEGFKDYNITKGSQSTVTLQQNGKSFTIKKKLLIQHDELIKMILATESMNSEERQYWFEMMPSMTDKHMRKLYNILDTERQKLQALEVMYQDEIKALNDKHLLEWSNFKKKESLREEKKGTGKNEYDMLLDKL